MPQDPPFSADDVAFLKIGGVEPFFQKNAIVIAGDKTDLLAGKLLTDTEPLAPGDLPDLFFHQPPHGKEHTGQVLAPDLA